MLLLVGAVFVGLAWDGARGSVNSAAQVDGERAQRSAAAVAEVVLRRRMSIQSWIDQIEPDVQDPASIVRMREDLQTWAEAEVENDVIARMVATPDGNVVAIGERTPGMIASNGIADDLRLFARQVAARDRPLTSDRMRLGDDTVFAIGAPIESDTPGKPSGVVVTAYDVERGPLGAIFSDQYREKAAELLLVRDARGRNVAGSPVGMPDDPIERHIVGTTWTLLLKREHIDTLLPTWAYPLFAGLLVFMAFGYSVQEVMRRRLRRESDEHMRQVRSLYGLASVMLHATTQRAQAEQLARTTSELVDVDAIEVTLSNEPGGEPIVAGERSPDQRTYRVAITGPHGPLGELIVARRLLELDADERSVVQTAAALAGAAMTTSATIEAERAAAAELQRLDELRSNLLATVAHELRSPVTAVKGVLGLLSMQDDLPERTRTYVNVATDRTDRLVALIQDLFDCSLLETGQLDIRPQRQPAAELLESALGAQAAARPGELLLSAPQHLMITVDPVRFDQLVSNLVTNAFRHGQAPVEVSVRPTTDGVVIVVADEGPGIDPEDRDRIFGKFWQGSTGHARLVEGAGLGLSLVQGLVALHGGRIRIDSTHADGRGARFTIWLPDVVPGS